MQTVPQSPNIPFAFNITDQNATQNYLTNLVQAITRELQLYAVGINVIVSNFNMAIVYPEYLKTALPDVLVNKGGMIMVTNDVGGYTPAFSDGTNWRRTADRNIIS